MKAQRVFRANGKSKAAQGREKALRDSLQAQKPSLEQLIRSGDFEPDSVITMGLYFDVCEALLALKGERQKRGLSITDISKTSGLDRALISRLENGKIDNPTLGTLTRYAGAVGKQILWSIRDAATVK